MFVGSQFCSHCGAKAVVAETSGKKMGDCPRCRRPLEPVTIGDSTLRECTKCSGLWSDIDTFELICADRERQSAVLTFGSRHEPTAAPYTRISYVPCPDCKEFMNRSNFARASGVIIDVCKQHGVWFDVDELPRIIQFIRGGGMEVARQRERYAIEQERESLREERRRIGADAKAFDRTAFSYDSGGSWVKTLLEALFS
jgi:Zn-finger nucleic acid-binding protein